MREDDEKIEVPDPEDDHLRLNDIANLYLFIEWFKAGQQPIGLMDLVNPNFPSDIWEDFKTLLGELSNTKRILKYKKKSEEEMQKPKKVGLFRG